MSQEPISVGENFKLKSLLDPYININAYNNGFIDIHSVEPSLGTPSTDTYTSPNSTYYFPVVTVDSLYGNSRKFTNYGNLLTINGNKIGIGTSTPTEKLTIFGNICARGRLYAEDLPYTMVFAGSSINATKGNNSVDVSSFSVIAGGCLNSASGVYESNIGGGFGNTICMFSHRSSILGGFGNEVCGNNNNITGGYRNCVKGSYGSVLGGCCNTASNYSSVVNGYLNTSGDFSTIAGGEYNCICNGSEASFIGGGMRNLIDAQNESGEGYPDYDEYSNDEALSFIGTGSDNKIYGIHSAILAGRQNTLSGSNSFILGSNIVTGTHNTTFVNNLSSQNKLEGTLLLSPSARFGESIIDHNLTVYGNLSVLGTRLDVNTSTVNTSSLRIVNYGVGPALYVEQVNPNYPVAAFVTAYDDPVLFVANAETSSSGGKVGINTLTPNETLTVVGNISATGEIFGHFNGQITQFIDELSANNIHANNIYTNNIYANNLPYELIDETSSIQTIRGSNTASGYYSSITGGVSSTTSGNYNFIGGGCNNNTELNYSIVAGGRNNTANGDEASVLGGSNNVAEGAGSIVGGGTFNFAEGAETTVTGGGNNHAQGAAATIGGGIANNTDGTATTVAGGSTNSAYSSGSTVAGGITNSAYGAITTIAGGQSNSINNSGSTIGGGYYNTINSNLATIGGGNQNIANGPYSTIGGGCLNKTIGDASTVAGGCFNTASGAYAVVAGGEANIASGDDSAILGGYANDTKGFANTFILGSELSASQTNFTYVNNLSAQGFIYGNIPAVSLPSDLTAVNLTVENLNVTRFLTASNIQGFGNEVIISDGLTANDVGNGYNTLSLNFTNGVYTSNDLYVSGTIYGKNLSNNLLNSLTSQNLAVNSISANVYYGYNGINVKNTYSDYIGYGGSGGNIYLNGGDGSTQSGYYSRTNGGNGGIIDLRGGTSSSYTGTGGNGGNIYLYGSGDYSGGGINTSGGGAGDGGSINTYHEGGNIDTHSSGGSINTSFGGGDIFTNGGVVNFSPVGGGSINTSLGGGDIFTYGNVNSGGSILTFGTLSAAGGSINTSNGGGSINTTGSGYYGGGSINTYGGGAGAGGSINTYHEGGNIDTHSSGGNIDTSLGGGNILTNGGVVNFSIVNGGSINTSLGGGSIDTTGNGYIEFGYDTTRTTLSGTATQNRNIFLPDASGTISLTNTTINEIADTTYTIQLSDNGGMITSTNSGDGLTATVVGTNYPVGFSVGFMQLGTAKITLSGQNITINQSENYTKTNKIYSVASLMNTGISGWVLFGDVSP